MNFLVGLLLSYIPREADAYGALVLLMQERQLRELYKPDMSLLQVRSCGCERSVGGSWGWRQARRQVGG